MTEVKLAQLDKLVPIIEDFPKKGIKFRNIAPLLRDPTMLNYVVDQLANQLLTTPVDVVVGLDARGFIFGVLLANKLGLSFVMARKPSKLPGKVEKVVYDLEYTSACLELEIDSIKEGQKVCIVDDILVTGGTILAACDLVAKLGGVVTAVSCFAEIPGLGGAEKIKSRTGVVPYSLMRCGDPLEEKHSNNSKDISPSTAIEFFECKYGSKISETSCDFELLYHTSMEGLAKSIAKKYPDLFRLRAISWETFPDGYANIKFPPDLAGKRVVFLASLFDKYSYMDQLSVMAVLPRQLIKSLHIILPYYAPGTMERIETPGIVATADTYAQITSSVFPGTKEGAPIIGIYDLHNSTTRHSFSNNLTFQPLSAIPLVLNELKTMFYGLPQELWAVAFPDEGSYKRFRGFIPNTVNMIVCGKVRDGNKRIVRIMDKIPAAFEISKLNHVVIVDDLVQTGGTLNECRIALKAEGVRHVSAFCTHAVFPRREYLNFFRGGKWDGFNTFFITDSIPARAVLLQKHEPFRVISLTDSIVHNVLLDKEDLCYYKGLHTKDNDLYYAHESDVVRVAVASKNADKVAAVKEAFEQLYPNRHVLIDQYEVKSSVANQPFNLSETTQGCQNRMESLRYLIDTTKMPHRRPFKYLVAMENGIDAGQVDFAIVRVEDRTKPEFVNYFSQTSMCKVSDEIYKEWKDLGDDKSDVTCGSLYSKKYNYSPSNWHVYECGKSRAYMLKNAIMQIFE
jgi:adenine phosphoribosyltransferase